MNIWFLQRFYLRVIGIQIVTFSLIINLKMSFFSLHIRSRDYGFDYEPVFRGHHLRDPEHVGSFNNNASNLMEISETSIFNNEEILGNHHETPITLPSSSVTTPKPFGVDPNFTDIEEIALKRELLFHSICTGNSFYVHLIPSILHVTAFGYMLCLYWFNYDEQLQTLMERVILNYYFTNC